MSIPFTEYRLPRGTRHHQEIERPDDVEVLAHRLILEGFEFTVELLNTGIVSMTCERDTPDGETEVIGHVLAPNNPLLEMKVDELVKGAYQRFTKKSRRIDRDDQRFSSQ